MEKKEYRITRLVQVPNTSIRMRKEKLADSWYIRNKYGVDILKKLDTGEKLDFDTVRLEKVKENVDPGV